MRLPLRLLATTGFLAVLLLSNTAIALELKIAVAANFTNTAKELAQAYTKQHGVGIGVSSGSTGMLYAQILNGAPYDLFFSADTQRALSLVDLGQAEGASYLVYAEGILALYSRHSDINNLHPDSLKEQLINQELRFLAIANPKNAPYGRAATQVLAHMGLENTPLATGASIGQAFQYVASGNADMGFVALSQILALPETKRGFYWLPENTLYSPIEQSAVILKRTPYQNEARRFLAFVRSESGRKIIESYGYRVP